MGVRGGLEAAPLLGLGMELGAPWSLDMEVQGQLTADAEALAVTVERWSGAVGASWSPVAPWAPTVGVGVSIVRVRLRSPGVDDLVANTVAPWAEVGVRGALGGPAGLGVGLRAGADLRDTVLVPGTGAEVALAPLWVEAVVTLTTDVRPAAPAP